MAARSGTVSRRVRADSLAGLVAPGVETQHRSMPIDLSESPAKEGFDGDDTADYSGLSIRRRYPVRLSRLNEPTEATLLSAIVHQGALI